MSKTVLTVFVVALVAADAVRAGPREECPAAGATLMCLDAKLKEANQKLNGTLKAAQERLEQLQAQGRRPVMGAFIDSQRKFNAYREAQCSWQGARAGPGENSAEYVRECQLFATLAREQELAAFARGQPEEAAVVAAPAQTPIQVESSTEVVVIPTPPRPVTGEAPAVQGAPATPDVTAAPLPAAPQPSTQPATAGRANEWRLLTWVVGGQQKPLLQDSSITIAFDPSGKVAGNASVNRFSGTYRFDNDGRLRWPSSGFAVTRMAGSPALMAQERVFLESLRRTSRYKVDGQQLVLENASSSVVLAFTR